ncbi:MAG: hypothetical protein P1P84_02375 [Deferrisomatales bacterium]|nr:hypothetical protein [Deferrisomatales bacterium]
MLRRFGVFCCVWIALSMAPALGSEGEVVTEYESRLEAIAAEIQQIRRELEDLVEELAEPEVGRVFVFLGAAPAEVRSRGVTVVVDDRAVFARPFTPAEQDVLDRGLPLELLDLRLLEGDHAVAIFPLDGDPTAPASFPVQRGVQASWVAQISASGVTWQRD